MCDVGKKKSIVENVIRFFPFSPLISSSNMAPKDKKDKRSGKEKRAEAKEAKLAENLHKLNLESEETNRVASGVLASHPDSKDIKIDSFSLSYYSQILINDTSIECMIRFTPCVSNILKSEFWPKIWTQWS